MRRLQTIVECLVRRLKGDPSYCIADAYTDRQLAIVLWHRGMQVLRGVTLSIRARGVRAPVFRGRRVIIEHAYAIASGPGLILEDGAVIDALSRDGVRLGRNVTVGRAATLTCTGVIARMGVGIRVGERSAIGAGSYLGGQGGITIGDDVIIGPGSRIFSENHNYGDPDRPIRAQGESRVGVTIGNDCWIGASVTILDGVTIGNGCVIAAGAVVTKSIPPLSLAVGVPARVLRSRVPEAGAAAPHDSELPPEMGRGSSPTAHARRANR